VGVGAGVFVLILVILILLPSGGGDPNVKASRDLYNKGLSQFQAGHYDQARATLDRVPATPPDIKAQAVGLIKQIEDTQKRIGSAASDDEKKAFDALYDFCEPNRANPNKFEAMQSMCQSFKDKYPKSTFIARVDEYLVLAAAGRKSTQKSDLADGEKQVQDEVKKNDFASAVRRLKELMNKHKDDAETHQKLGNTLGEIQDKAKAYSRSENQKAGDLLARGKRDEAQVVYQALIVSMGDGTIPELEDYANIAKTALQGLK
jgi:outer membrane protein assembly factor BamD (BamD/ComL family)